MPLGDLSKALDEPLPLRRHRVGVGQKPPVQVFEKGAVRAGQERFRFWFSRQG
jgi:hypothetical protein